MLSIIAGLFPILAILAVATAIETLIPLRRQSRTIIRENEAKPIPTTPISARGATVEKIAGQRDARRTRRHRLESQIDSSERDHAQPGLLFDDDVQRAVGGFEDTHLAAAVVAAV